MPIRTSTPKDIVCFANIRSGLKHHKLSCPPLIESREDRCFFRMDKEFFQAVLRLKTAGAFVKLCGTYRENEHRFPMEITFHKDRIEIDHDYWNPYHLVGAVPHLFFECIPHKISGLLHRVFPSIAEIKTDPCKVRAGLIKRGIIMEDA